MFDKRHIDKDTRESINAEYNEEPVHFCKRCLSLNIRVDNNNDEYCENCTSTNILRTSIFKWEKLYKEKYGIKFLDNNFNIGDF